MRNSVSGADLHKYSGHRIVIDGVHAHLLWADDVDNGIMLRVRTAERGREYLVRENAYVVSENPERILNDDATDRWDNEPPFVPPAPAPTHDVVVAPSRPGLLDWRCSCGETSEYDYGSFGRAADAAADHAPADEALTITRPYSTGSEGR